MVVKLSFKYGDTPEEAKRSHIFARVNVYSSRACFGEELRIPHYRFADSGGPAGHKFTLRLGSARRLICGFPS